MGMTKTTDLSRVNMNLPTSIVNRVKEYADKNGLNVTSAYIVLINRGLVENEMIDSLPIILNSFKDIKSVIEEKQNQTK